MNLAQYEDEVDRNEEEADLTAREEHDLCHDSATDPVENCFVCDEELWERQEAERQEAEAA